MPGDVVKVIKFSGDVKWINIGYINAMGKPLSVLMIADSLGR